MSPRDTGAGKTDLREPPWIRFCRVRYFVLLLFFLAAFPSCPPGAQAGDWNRRGASSMALHAGFFSFLVIGDTRGPNSCFPAVLEAAKRERGILFAVHLGDIVNYSVEKEYEEMFFRPVEDLPWPMLVIPGNHERYRDGSASLFREYFGSPPYFAFSVGDSRFVLLDNSCRKAMDSGQMEWLRREMEGGASRKNLFVFLHMPLEDPRNGPKPHAMEDPWQIGELRRLFEKGNVTMAFSGHIHSWYSGFWGKTPYIITGGGGSPLYGKDPKASFHHYVRVDVMEDGPRFTVIKAGPGTP